ncbi:MAG TPA: response regulator [Geobacter sp.]|nr:response regulator [Geobacter sp.]
MEGDHPLSILLVEDDATSREILASMLAVKFPQVAFLLANNGKTGLEAFKKHSPALVITDLNMPVMDGISMAAQIKSIDAGVKLIALTAFSDKSVRENSNAEAIGIDHYILKPVDYRMLLTTIQQCLPGIAPLPSPPHVATEQ